MTTNKLFTIVRSCLLPVPMMMVLACSGGSDDSGVSGSKSLGDVTDAEAMAICGAFNTAEKRADIQKAGCYIGSITASEGDEAACQALYDTCIAEENDEEETACANARASDLPACASMVTVGEFEACQSDRFAVITTLASELSCSSEAPTEDTFDPPASCAALVEKCPELSDF